jgi:hypothetical protein
MAYAAAADVQAVLGRVLSTEDTAMVERRLAQVERMIIRRIPDLVDQIDAGALDEADVIDIEAEAVLRVIRNPDGVYSESDGTYTYTKSAEAADNRLRILPEEWQTLGLRVGKMFSIVPNLVAPVSVSSFWTGG